ncbi:hypothetical protein [Rubellicoccus peritrichatus]|uniref:Uncharacterized protein n=1 Tax=Rubellicoccus peritrichatus TaxID=3080537 RepID=A0AAQ3QWF7_9BACT|nr:hypothetical protein [Puniceicoccus sp. CR14]WOO41837.1 hypothetical protein RZN69_01965 [Puniceicoccus sp. CR14]
MMRHIFRISLPVLFVFTLWGCSGPQVQYSPLNNPVTATGESIEQAVESRGPISPDDVRIFVTQKPEKPYRELGVLSYSTAAYIPNEERSFQLFKQKAAAVGADGVIILQSREQSTNYTDSYYAYRWPNPNSNLTTFRGMAIQFTD